MLKDKRLKEKINGMIRMRLNEDYIDAFAYSSRNSQTSVKDIADYIKKRKKRKKL